MMKNITNTFVLALTMTVPQALANAESSILDDVKETRDLATTCSFKCPANSYRIPNRSCYRSFDDCACSAGYTKKQNQCVKTNACALPPQVLNFSIMTWGDCTIAGHSMYKGVSIGGAFYDGSPDEYGTIDRTMSFMKYLNPNNKFKFNGGLTVGLSVPKSVQAIYDQLNYVANNAVSAKYQNGYEVFVVTRGGTYDIDDFVHGGQSEDNGKTLVIFRTHEDVILTSANGRQFGPSVLAPFAKVTVMGDAGYVDGFVIGNSVQTSGSNANGLQFHGDGYTGPLTCQ